MIRPLRKEDIDTVVDIADRAWKEIHRMYHEHLGDGLFEILFPSWETAKGKSVRKTCEKYPEKVHICEREECIAGFISFSLNTDKKIGSIGNNAKDPHSNEKGVGQEMYKAVFDLFREEGMLYASVGTGLDWAHEPARKAYERAGFNMKHEDVTYYMKL